MLAALVMASGGVASMALDGLNEVMGIARGDVAGATTAETSMPLRPMPPAVDVVPATTYVDAARGLATAQCERVDSDLRPACVRGAKVALFRALQARAQR